MIIVKRFDLDELAYFFLILNFTDYVIRKIGKHECIKVLWEKLEEIYTKTSLPKKKFLLEKHFRVKLDLNKYINDNLDSFNRLGQDTKLTIDKTIVEYSPIVLLNAIHDSYNYVKSVIKYARDKVS